MCCDLIPTLLIVILLAIKIFKLISSWKRAAAASLKCTKWKLKKKTALISFLDFLTFSPEFLQWTWHGQKTHPRSAVSQPCSDSSISQRRKKERKSVLELLDLVYNVLFAQRGYLCNVSHSLLSHWICWHTVSGSRLWSTRSILRLCAAVDMATILVD